MCEMGKPNLRRSQVGIMTQCGKIDKNRSVVER